MNQIIKAGALVCALAMLEWNPAAVAEEKRLGDYIYVPAMSDPAGMGAISLRVEGVKSGENGEKVQLTDARLLSLLSSKDRAVRKAAYTNIMNGYNKFGNTIAATYAGQVKADIFNSRAHHFDSSRQAAMFPDEIDEKVYDSLIEAVHGGIGTLNEYLSVKKEQLGVPVLHMYDLYAEAENSFEIGMDVEEAFKVFLEAVKPLGEDYVKDASRALPERWIDVYETKNKRSGAYSCGSAYRTTPYVLLNHKNTYDGLSTLCHEMGHAMHSFYSNKNQPFAKADYTIFVAEVASTCNEILLSEYLREQYAGNKQAQIALIGSLLQHFRTTVFRQTMFAEFEKRIHEKMAEEGTLTADGISELYLSINKEYFGPDMISDPQIALEWARIPHFYTPFYVYQYATGFSAAIAISSKILAGEPGIVEKYKQFLSGGCSMDPIDLLKICGVDMTKPEPVEEALDVFASYVEELEKLTAEA